MFADVQEEGPTQRAGIESGDLLLSINGEPVDSAKPPQFRVGSSVCLGMAKRDGHNAEVRFDIPNPKSRQLFTLPRPVVHRTIRDVGYLKINIFPGLVGIDVARDIDRAIASFQDCDRLIVDLRGNSGGGLGALRLMSYLTLDRRPLGYSLTRARAQRGCEKERLVRFSGIPSSKWQLPLLALRYAFRDRSIVLVTEGLGPQPFHGRIAILVNQHSASAAEMIAAFAQENSLARIIWCEHARPAGGQSPVQTPRWLRPDPARGCLPDLGRPAVGRKGHLTGCRCRAESRGHFSRSRPATRRSASTAGVGRPRYPTRT